MGSPGEDNKPTASTKAVRGPGCRALSWREKQLVDQFYSQEQTNNTNNKIMIVKAQEISDSTKQ